MTSTPLLSLTGPELSVKQIRQTHAAELEAIARYRRTSNYIAAAQVYLKDNVLLREALKPEHIKDRLLGHWGTCPGINLIYAHLNRIIRRYDLDMFLITGPGHGAPAMPLWTGPIRRSARFSKRLVLASELINLSGLC